MLQNRPKSKIGYFRHKIKRLRWRVSENLMRRTGKDIFSSFRKSNQIFHSFYGSWDNHRYVNTTFPKISAVFSQFSQKNAALNISYDNVCPYEQMPHLCRPSFQVLSQSDRYWTFHVAIYRNFGRFFRFRRQSHPENGIFRLKYAWNKIPFKILRMSKR